MGGFSRGKSSETRPDEEKKKRRPRSKELEKGGRGEERLQKPLLHLPRVDRPLGGRVALYPREGKGRREKMKKNYAVHLYRKDVNLSCEEERV